MDTKHEMSAPERAFLMACISSAQSYLALAAADPLDAIRWIAESRKWLDQAEAARRGNLGDEFRPPKSLEPKPRSGLPSRQTHHQGKHERGTRAFGHSADYEDPDGGS